MRGFLLPKNGLTETDFTIWSIHYASNYLGAGPRLR